MEEEDAVGLKASLGLIQGCTIIVGSIIGSGIFIAPGGVLKQTGSVNMSLTIWILSGEKEKPTQTCFDSSHRVDL